MKVEEKLKNLPTQLTAGQNGRARRALWQPPLHNSYWGLWKCSKHSSFFDLMKALIQNDLVFAIKPNKNDKSDSSSTVILCTVCY